MRELVRATRTVCSRCIYGPGTAEGNGCDYFGITGQSRIFENGKKAYDPEYCDKFVYGKKIVRKASLSLPGRFKDGEWPLGFNPWQE